MASIVELLHVRAAARRSTAAIRTVLCVFARTHGSRACSRRRRVYGSISDGTTSGKEREQTKVNPLELYIIPPHQVDTHLGMTRSRLFLALAPTAAPLPCFPITTLPSLSETLRGRRLFGVKFSESTISSNCGRRTRKSSIVLNLSRYSRSCGITSNCAPPL